MTMTMEKTCTKCRAVKPAHDFSRDGRGKDGLCCWCKDCTREHQQANRVARLEYQREYRASHRDEIAEGKSRWHRANRDTELERIRRYRADNVDALKERAIRRYRDGGRPADKPWPDRPIAYTTAHDRVKATYGAASNYPCTRCGEQAFAWSYDYSDPNPLWRKGEGLWAGYPPFPYSSDPDRYDPLCRSCHVKRDRYGAA